MTSAIRILHLEDSPRDAELIRLRLESAGLECEISHVESRAAFESALSSGSHDVILCDYNLPGYDGITALQHARAARPDTPVMLISGTLSEEEAVRCIHFGATDYLFKERLERLPSAVKRAIHEAEESLTRKRTEEALHESELRFRQLAEQSSEGFMFTAVRPEHTLYASPAIERIWGIDAGDFYRDPQAWIAAIHATDRAGIKSAWSACLTGTSPRFEAEYRVVRSDRSTRWVLHSGTPISSASGEMIRLSSVVRDVTDRKSQERQRLRNERLETIGTLTGGVAHDLNNALAPILLGTGMLRMRYPEDTDLIDMIETSARHGAEMIRHLLTFARGVEGERLLIQPGVLLNEIQKLIRTSFPENIALVAEIAPDLRPVLGDATQLHQVLTNLCINARDAMPGGGTLTIRAQNIDVDETFARTVPEARPGPHIVVRIVDTGVGIPPEILERIFEPFFTTKGPSKGTGLGLSTVLGIVRSHGGFVRVYSTAGQGSSFAVYLPATTAPASDKSPSRVAASIDGRGEVILLVDDDPGVREVTRAVLSALNFRVLTAPDGISALVLVAERARELRAVITDFHMPQMDGLTFLRVLRSRLPKAGIIVASGHIDVPATAELEKIGVHATLNKPFNQESLVDALRSLLG